MRAIFAIFAILSVFLGFAIDALAVPTLSIENVNIAPGGTANLSLNLSDGTEPYAGFNAKIILPKNITVIGIAEGTLLSEGNYATDFQAFSTTNYNGANVIGYSATDVVTMPGGQLLNIIIQATSTAQTGDYTASFAASNDTQMVNSRYALSNSDGSMSIIPNVVAGTIAITEVDIDLDGLPDAWEQMLIDFDPNDSISSIQDVLPGDDFDGDGESNQAEYTNQTDPTDPSSNQSSRHFGLVTGNPSSEIWTIYMKSAVIDGTRLKADDEIAIFDGNTLVGSYKLSGALTEADQWNNYLTVWSELKSGPGYTPGNGFTVKCWDADNDIEYIGQFIFSNPYGDAYTGTTFPSGDNPYSIADVAFTSSRLQQFQLDSGYQLVSLYVDPLNPDMTSVLSGVLAELNFVKDSQGNMFRKIGPTWVNNIGNWKIGDGYLIRMNSSAQLSVNGSTVAPSTPIPITSGYQFVAYLPSDPNNPTSQYALTAFNEILDNLQYAKNTEGALLRKIGTNWVNNVGNLNPGEGYLLKMNADDILQYVSQNAREALKSTKSSLKSSHFGTIGGNPADPTWTIYLAHAEMEGVDLDAGDEIAVFDGDTLVGLKTLTEQLTEENQYRNYLTVWSTLDDGPGYTVGNPITIRAWDASENTEYEVVDISWNDAISDAYAGNIFPDGEAPFSIASINFKPAWISVDGDDINELTDVIIILKILTGQEISNVSINADINRDKKIGIEEAIHALRDIAGLN